MKQALLVACWVPLSIACATSHAAQPPRASATREPVPTAAPADPEAAYGARLFGIFCRSCHGEHGRGDGPVARELSLAIPDLRLLAANAPDGAFPATRVAAVIDGRDPVDGHGTRDMPVWGLTFRDPGLVAEQESDVEERIASLVAYLRSIQTRP